MDCIRVLGMAFSARHGVHSWEKSAPQRFEVDVELERDLSTAAVSDRLEDTVNYGSIVAVVRSVMEGEPVNLLEHLAGSIAGRVGELATGSRVTVRVRKPGAPLEVPFRTVEIELVREAQE